MDYANRTKREKELTAALLLLFRDPDIFGSPARIQSELSNLLATFSAATFADAAGLVAADRIELSGGEQAARDFAGPRATEVAQGFVDRTVELLRGPEPPEPDEIFSDARAEAIAITETTAAANAGTEYAVTVLVAAGILGQSAFDDAIWRTAADAAVCPVCAPLDGTTRSVWDNEVPGGPPAHPRCRCFLEYPGL